MDISRGLDMVEKRKQANKRDYIKMNGIQGAAEIKDPGTQLVERANTINVR